ncbi:hypothetical protein E2542_SST23739 [Spatholobus suberectus]|nr:hypothetical protein E2542_SST23739 [Spatholobus suberectus]
MVMAGRAMLLLLGSSEREETGKTGREREMEDGEDKEHRHIWRPEITRGGASRRYLVVLSKLIGDGTDNFSCVIAFPVAILIASFHDCSIADEIRQGRIVCPGFALQSLMHLDFVRNISLPTSATRFSLSFSHPLLCAYNGLSLPTSRVFAKFEKFQTQPSQSQEPDPSSSLEEKTETSVRDDEEDDSCLPSDLEGAVRQSSEAAALFVSSGGMRAIVELLIPQLQFLDDEGAQVELWELSRIFLDTLIEEKKCQRVKAIFPDAGAAALLKYRWKDALFRFASLSDRKPVESDDEIVVMVVPDYQMLEYVERIASNLSNDPPRPLIMWNPRLISEDVGVGVNVRKLRRFFLSTFTTVYFMRPMPFGAIFRCYPGLWKVFSDDKDRPNRYLLAKEFESRPDAEDIELLFGDEEQKSEQGQGLLDKAAGIFSSISRIMKSI